MSLFIAELRRDLAERAGEIRVEIDRLDALKSELVLIDKALDALPLEQISQLELRDKVREEGGSNSQEQSSEETAPRPRKRPTRLTNEQARDWILEVREFTTAELQLRFGVSRGTAQNRCNDLQRMSIIVPGEQPGRWAYNGNIPKAPSVRPRGERLLGVPQRRKAGTAVPGTGVPRGPADTPGGLRRQQSRAAKVKMPKRTGVRL